MQLLFQFSWRDVRSLYPNAQKHFGKRMAEVFVVPQIPREQFQNAKTLEVDPQTGQHQTQKGKLMSSQLISSQFQNAKTLEFNSQTGRRQTKKGTVGGA
jgi:hypothetical protein